MRLITHTSRNFADAIKALLPLGAAWQWPIGGLGDFILLAIAAELARLELALQGVLDNAIATHQPAQSSWHISEYRRIATAALDGKVEDMPRKRAAIGSRVGNRLWGHNAPSQTFAIPLLQVDHLIGPARIGSKVGNRLWSTRTRYILRVRYYRSVVDPKPVWDALTAFKQAHVYLWFEDITGRGGSVIYA